jgi:hypothetical protein
MVRQRGFELIEVSVGQVHHVIDGGRTCGRFVARRAALALEAYFYRTTEASCESSNPILRISLFTWVLARGSSSAASQGDGETAQGKAHQFYTTHQAIWSRKTQPSHRRRVPPGEWLDPPPPPKFLGSCSTSNFGTLRSSRRHTARATRASAHDRPDQFSAAKGRCLKRREPCWRCGERQGMCGSIARGAVGGACTHHCRSNEAPARRNGHNSGR